MLFFDQCSKIFVSNKFILGGSLEVSSFFSWTYVRNDGAAFGFLANSYYIARYFLLFISIFAALFVIYWINKTDINNRLILFAKTILLSGILGNLIDRFIYGEVIDFIDFHYKDLYWPVFNLADSFIMIGVILLIFNTEKKRS